MDGPNLDLFTSLLAKLAAGTAGVDDCLAMMVLERKLGGTASAGAQAADNRAISEAPSLQDPGAEQR